MQRMLEISRKSSGSPFDAVIVDDLSRLSRDLGNTWRIVFDADLRSRQTTVRSGLAFQPARPIVDRRLLLVYALSPRVSRCQRPMSSNGCEVCGVSPG